MSMPLSPTRLFVCQACGAILPIGEEHVGKKCRCGRCGKVSLVSDATPKKPPKPRPPKAKQNPKIHARPTVRPLGTRQGPQLRRNLRPPAQVFPRLLPRLRYPDARSPRASRQKTDLPRLRRQNRHQRTSKTKAEKVGPSPRRKRVSTRPDPNHSVRPLPLFTPPTTPSQKTTDPIRQEQTARPKLPRLPILQGVLKMLLRGPVPTWFIGLSAVGLLAAGTMMATAGQHPIVAIPFFIVAGLCGLMGLAAASAICLAVLTESSEGNDRLYNPPGPMFFDWMGDFSTYSSPDLPPRSQVRYSPKH